MRHRTKKISRQFLCVSSENRSWTMIKSAGTAYHQQDFWTLGEHPKSVEHAFAYLQIAFPGRKRRRWLQRFVPCYSKNSRKRFCCVRILFNDAPRHQMQLAICGFSIRERVSFPFSYHTFLNVIRRLYSHLRWVCITNDEWRSYLYPPRSSDESRNVKLCFHAVFMLFSWFDTGKGREIWFGRENSASPPPTSTSNEENDRPYCWDEVRTLPLAQFLAMVSTLLDVCHGWALSCASSVTIRVRWHLRKCWSRTQISRCSGKLVWKESRYWKHESMHAIQAWEPNIKENNEESS